MNKINKPLLISWLLALIATLGSLYFSNVLQFIPCDLCWYERIFMYPLAIILGIAFYRNDRDIYKYALPVSAIGMLISGYHILLQEVPYIQQFEKCSYGVPCSKDYLNLFGFITIPMLSFAAFAVIIISLVILMRKNKANLAG